MGSAAEEPFNGIDGSVGGLVWVRRRNGSWWPGRILSPDELPDGCLPAPRSGTPVKLLGREDASVDWYNLEKSKRVKAFRCGEYNDCIEKAKASASHLSKKAVKYARREDAILHALELESARLGKDFLNLPAQNSPPDNGEHHHGTHSPPSIQSEEDFKGNSSYSVDESDSAPELSQSGVSFEEPKKGLDEMKEECKRKRNPNDSEDEGFERIKKRMRGLEDLGMGVGSSPGKKRSRLSPAHEFLKKKNRRRTLSKVLECTPMVCVPVLCEPISSPARPCMPADSKVSGPESNESNKMNKNNSDSTTTGVSCENGVSLSMSRNDGDGSKGKENEISSVVGVCEDGSCERLFDVLLVTEEKQQLADAPEAPSVPSPKSQSCAGPHSSQTNHADTVFSKNKEHYEKDPTVLGPADTHNTIPTSEEEAGAYWRVKGKRYPRPRKTEADDDMPRHNRFGGPIREIRAHKFHMSKTDKCAPQRLLLPHRHPVCHHITDSGPHLHDVSVEVQMGYARPQHVPYISLMSRLNGRPVMGYPVSVEALADGLSGDLLLPAKSRCKSKPRRNGPRNGLLNKKIRKLSTLTGYQKPGQQHEKKPVLEKVKGPSIPCVPLKVVFSRINAALSGSVRPIPPRVRKTNNP